MKAAAVSRQVAPLVPSTEGVARLLAKRRAAMQRQHSLGEIEAALELLADLEKRFCVRVAIAPRMPKRRRA